MRPWIIIGICLALLAAPLAAASLTTVRYVGGSYWPGLANGDCVGGNNLAATPGVLGACQMTIDVRPSIVSVTDDVLGPRPFYWWLTMPGTTQMCVDGYGLVGPNTIDVPAGCTHLSVVPAVGSTTGVVRVD